MPPLLMSQRPKESSSSESTQRKSSRLQSRSTPNPPTETKTQKRKETRDNNPNRRKKTTTKPTSEAQPATAPSPTAASSNMSDDDTSDPPMFESVDEGSNYASLAAAQALQGLFRRLGGGESLFGDLGLSRPTGPRIQTIMSRLRSGDPTEISPALTQLCDQLSVSGEDAVGRGSVEALVPTLIDLINDGYSPEIEVMAVRAITNLMEYVPSSRDVAVNCSIGTFLCAKLLSIEFIDLAEEALGAIEKLSDTHAAHLLECDATVAVLSFIDFFSSSVQRSALHAVANMCKHVTAAHFDSIRSSIPQLTNFLGYSDAKILQLAVSCLQQLAATFALEPSRLAEILSPESIKGLMMMIVRSDRPGPAVHTDVTSCLSIAVKAGRAQQQVVLDTGLIASVRSVLRASVSSGDGAQSRTSQQLLELLSLVSDLLPSLPPGMLSESSGRRSSRRSTPEVVSTAETHIFFDAPDKLSAFCAEIMDTTVLLATNTIHSSIRTTCASIILKLAFFCDAQSLESAIPTLSLCTYVSQMLTSSDPSHVTLALRIGLVLVEKIPGEGPQCLYRAGVLQQCKVIADGSENAEMESIEASLPFGCLIRQPLCPMTRVREDDKNGGRVDNSSLSRVRLRASDSSKQVERLKDLALQLVNAISQVNFASDAVVRMTAIASRLKDVNGSKEDALASLNDLASELSKENGATVFEITASGIIASLLQFLNSPSVTSEAEVLTRVHAIVAAGLQDLEADGSLKRRSLLRLLVKHLIDVLEKIDPFSLSTHSFADSSSNTLDPMASLKVLAQPLKLRLERLAGDTSVKDFAIAAVMIEPMATVQAVEDFLYPKVRISDSSDPPNSFRSPLARNMADLAELAGLRHSGVSSRGEDDDDNDDDLLEGLSVESPAPVDMSLSGLSPFPRAGNAAPSPLHLPNAAEVTPPTKEQARRADEIAPDVVRDRRKLRLIFDGAILPADAPIFEVVHRSIPSGDDSTLPSLWAKIHTLKYCSASHPINTPECSVELLPEQLPPLETVLDVVSSHSAHPTTAALVPRPVVWVLHILASDLAESHQAVASSTCDVLMLLKIIHDISENWGSVSSGSQQLIPSSDFVSLRLMTKLERQLNDPLSLCAKAVPSWCRMVPLICPFLFTFDSRVALLSSTAFGVPRALHAFMNRHLDPQGRTTENSVRVSRIQRQKVRIHRSKVMESAVKVIDQYASAGSLLEIEYYDEVGTGSGPSMEFYTLVAESLREKDRLLWIDATPSNGDKFVDSPRGLYPSPLPMFATEGSERVRSVTELFRFIGKVAAKALKDGRLLELPLHHTFLKMALGLEWSLLELATIVPEVSTVLVSLERHQLDADDLCLWFTLPTESSLELIPAGSTISVTAVNVDEYVALVRDAYLGRGVVKQIEAFRDGFNAVFPIANLLYFDMPEVEILICGEKKQLSFQILMQNVRLDHGYTISSPIIQMLFEVVDEMIPSEQRQFIMFVTGSPRLPVGGLLALNPRLTVVKKVTEVGGLSDDYLPSVMTCVNYLKLPDYTSKAVLRMKLFVAISDGLGSFHLS